MRTIGLLLLCSLLGGCLQINVPQSMITNTNDSMVVLPPGVPTARFTPGPDWRIVNDDIATPDGPLHMVLAGSDADRPLIVYCGGQAFIENNAGAAALKALAPFGDMVLFDYPGLGQSHGHGTKAEYLAALDTVTTRIEALAAQRRGKLVFWGHSLGTGFCAALAAKVQHPSLLVMAGGFDTVEDAADGLKQQTYWYSPLIDIRFDEDVLNFHIAQRLAHYNGPILLLATKADRTITYDVSQKLAQKLRDAGRTVTFVSFENISHSRIHQAVDFPEKMTTALAPYGIRYSPQQPGPVTPGGLIWPDGSRYEGASRDGVFDGEGTLYYADGSVLQARFDKGNLVGMARFTDTDGHVLAGPIHDAHLVTPAPDAAETEAQSQTSLILTLLVDGAGNPTLGLAAIPPQMSEADAWQILLRLRPVVRSQHYQPATINGHPVPVPVFLRYRGAPAP